MSIDLDDVWASAWANALADTQQKSDVPIEAWRKAGRTTKDKPNGEDLAWWNKAGRDQVGAYADWLRESGWKIAVHNGEPLVEFALFHTFAHGTAPVKGYVDAVMVTPDGQYVIVDYKTGSRHPAGPHQLALYATMMKEMGLPAPTLGSYYLTRKGSLGPIEDLTRWDTRFFDKLFKQLNAAKSMQIYLPTIADHCGYCGVNKYCYAYGGSESAEFDPDDPNYTKPQF